MPLRGMGEEMQEVPPQCWMLDRGEDKKFPLRLLKPGKGLCGEERPLLNPPPQCGALWGRS